MGYSPKQPRGVDTPLEITIRKEKKSCPRCGGTLYFSPDETVFGPTYDVVFLRCRGCEYYGKVPIRAKR